MRSFWLWFELIAIYTGVPLALAAWQPPRPLLYILLWLMVAYGILILRRNPEFSWRRIWHGVEWPLYEKRQALLRHLIISLTAIGAIAVFAQPLLFSFPLQRPGLWLMVMLLYPILSALPQEIVFRVFFLERYRPLFKNERLLMIYNVLCFSALHVMFNNWVAPLLSAIGGMIFLDSYRQHRALKWIALEHAAYGCMIFTVGLGRYFFFNSAHP
ncbi:MAG: CPBP family glutamic-type intramembrane protease [Alphaproteobacteria bacterium]